MIAPLLRDRTFRTFWTGQTISMVGDQISLFAVPITAVLLLHADALHMGLLTAAGILPSLLFSLAAGARDDRRGHRRRTMLLADIARAGLMASIPVSYLCGVLSLAQLYAVAFAVGTFDVLFSVAYSTLFVSTVKPEQFVDGQSLLNGSRAMSFVGGQGLAGLLVAVITAPGALVLDALSFLASAFALARINPTEPPPAPAAEANLIAGARWIRRTPLIRASLCATATVNLCNFAFSAIFILYATRSLHVQPSILGFVLSAGALGGVAGAIVTKRITRRIGLGRASALSYLLFTAPFLLVPLAGGPKWVELGCLFLAEFGSGVGVMLLDISIGTIFAVVIPNEMRSRVMGAYRTVNYGVRPVGALLGGVLGAAIGLNATLWLVTVAGMASVLWVLPSPLLRFTEPVASRAREPVPA